MEVSAGKDKPPRDFHSPLLDLVFGCPDEDCACGVANLYLAWRCWCWYCYHWPGKGRSFLHPRTAPPYCAIQRRNETSRPEKIFTVQTKVSHMRTCFPNGLRQDNGSTIQSDIPQHLANPQQKAGNQLVTRVETFIVTFSSTHGPCLFVLYISCLRARSAIPQKKQPCTELTSSVI